MPQFPPLFLEYWQTWFELRRSPILGLQSPSGEGWFIDNSFGGPSDDPVEDPHFEALALFRSEDRRGDLEPFLEALLQPRQICCRAG